MASRALYCMPLIGKCLSHEMTLYIYIYTAIKGVGVLVFKMFHVKICCVLCATTAMPQ